jgi:LCP family protein required for cell wall assembly
MRRTLSHSQAGYYRQTRPRWKEAMSVTRVARREASTGGSRRLKRRKRGSPVAKFFVVLGALLMIISGVGVVMAHQFIGSATDAVQQQNLLGEAGLTGNNIDGPINMLLVGIDVRPDQHDDSVRADTIMMLQIPASHDQAVMISLPRDLQVKIPDYPKSKFKGWTTKINAAFQGGYQGPGTEIEKRGRGTELLALTIKQNFGITFQGAAIIDFDGFEAVLKELGGVTMCVDAPAEAIHLALDKNGNVLDGPIWYDDEAGEVRGIPPGGKKLIYKTGCQHMEPNVALEYSRLRKGACCPNGDYDRQRHQQQLIRAILKEATNKNLLKDLGKLNRVIQAAGKAFVLDTGGVSVSDYLFTLKDVAGSDFISVRTNAGQVNTIPGGSDEALTPESKDMIAAFKNNTLPTWLASHPDFIGPR